jgi:adenylosuccinate synthase
VVRAIVGANWGDEGKGKLTDLFASESDMVIRFQGGANAGHTIINPYGKFALHQLPSGIFFGHVTNVLGNGVALNIPALIKEIKSIQEAGVPDPKLVISNRAQMVMPYHVLFDQYEEEWLSDRRFGSTKSGIAPFYSDKYAKIGFQVSELFDESALNQKLEYVIGLKNILVEHRYKKPKLDAHAIREQLIEWRRAIKPYVGDTVRLVREALEANQRILLEGQLGALKDPDFGIYPYVTSSSTLAGYGAIGSGLPPYAIREIIAVVKAYSSAVGAGAFVSELHGKEADELRRRGGDAGEYGATTGRPRRMGWFDAVATRYGCHIQGATAVALTAIDVLSYLDEIPVCIGYEIDGEVTRDFPVTTYLNRAKPVYSVLPGWKTDIRGIRDFSQLPEKARAYVRFVEKEIGVPVQLVSNGPHRDEIIRL